MFVLPKGRSKEEAFSIDQDIARKVTAANLKPVKLKFEKVTCVGRLMASIQMCVGVPAVCFGNKETSCWFHV
jgi:hypothetical protein